MFGRRSTPPEAIDPDAVVPTKSAKAAPPPPPRRRVRRPRGGLMSMLSGIMTFAVVIGGVVVFGLIALQHEVSKPGPLEADKTVLIPKATGTSEIAALLAKEGITDNPVLFETYSYLKRGEGQLKAGEFLFKAKASIGDAINTLIKGDAILHSVTVPEGLTSEQIVARLRDNDVLAGDLSEVPREGSLLPNTYKVERGTTRRQVVNMMQAANRQALSEVWAGRNPDLPIKTPQELVILASIVEKETGVAAERPRVAGVFVNRLQRRMKLQSDPTIVYGIVGGKGTLGRGITRAEIDRPTPYNTYTIEGLPPGPIANPGRAALQAAAKPMKTREVFFVADGSGGHAFADTYEQHQRNVARWRQIERSRDGQGAAPTGGGEVDRAAPPETRTDYEAASPVRSASVDPGATPQAVRAFDASEGTARDPLLNRTWDLSSAKTVPSLGPDSGALPEPRPQRQRQRQPAAKAAEALPPGVRMPIPPSQPR